MTLLNSFNKLWKNKWNSKLFLHISTDEVYGTLGESGFLRKQIVISLILLIQLLKQALIISFVHMVKLSRCPISFNCSNNYGPYQFPEKLIPLFINNILNKKPLPVYGDGNYTRDWLYVIDHAIAIDHVFHKGINKETYNIGGFNEWKNIDLVKLLCDKMDKKLYRDIGTSEKTYYKRKR